MHGETRKPHFTVRLASSRAAPPCFCPPTPSLRGAPAAHCGPGTRGWLQGGSGGPGSTRALGPQPAAPTLNDTLQGRSGRARAPGCTAGCSPVLFIRGRSPGPAPIRVGPLFKPSVGQCRQTAGAWAAAGVGWGTASGGPRCSPLHPNPQLLSTLRAAKWPVLPKLSLGAKFLTATRPSLKVV